MTTDPSAPDNAPPPDAPPPGAPLESSAPQPSGEHGLPEPRRPVPLERWLWQNLAPLLVLAVMYLLQVLLVALLQHGKQVVLSEKAPAEAPAISLEELAKLPFARAVVGAVVSGFLIAVAAGLAYLASSRAEQWLKRFFAKRPRRPWPALRILDFLAVGATYISLGQFLSVALLLYFPIEGSARSAWLFIVNDLALGLAVLVGVLLARHRAGGAHGSRGIWPFWRLSSGNPPRSLWSDIGLGVACYPLTVWIVNAAVALNTYFVERMGWKSEEHALVGQMLEHPPLWVLIVYFVAATVGAALFEELIFRGMLYNSLRRYFGGLTAAVIAAAVFAWMHLSGAQNRGELLGLFVLALLLTWLYERTGRLVAPMAFHAMNNLVSLLIVLSLTK